MRSVSVTLAVGLTLTAIAIGLTLTRSPLSVAATNGIPAEERLAVTTINAGACQANEVLPRGTSAIRISIQAFTGPRVKVKVLSGTHVLTSGELGSGWTGKGVLVPVRPVPSTTSNVKVCFALILKDEHVNISGRGTPPAVAARSEEGEALLGRVRIEYLRPGHSSWASLASMVARHMGLGHAWSGTWIVLLVATLTAGVAILSSALVLRELR
jgi:hypothetical protein